MVFLLFSILTILLLSFVGALPVERRAVSPDLLTQLAFFEQYAAAAYCPDNNIPLSSNVVVCSAGNCPLVQAVAATTLVEFQDVGLTDGTGFVAVDNTNRQIIVSFRGSVSIKNWLTNLNIKMAPYSQCSGCTVHAGFYDSWLGLKDLIGTTLTNARSNYPGYQIVLTGHSLGAAIATLAAGDLRTQGFSLSLYTYGSPMAGNVAFVNFITSQGNNYRVTHKEDPVPKLPGYLLGYGHTSSEYWITSSTDATVTMTDIKVSSGAVNFAGNGGTWGSNVNDHGWYFNRVAACAPAQLEL